MHFFYLRLVALFFCLLLAFASGGQACHETKVSVHVSANVIQTRSTEIITLQNISFMRVSRLNGELFISPLTDVRAGLMHLKGEPGSRIRVSCILTDELSGKSGNGRIPVRYRLGGNEERMQRTAKLIDTGELFITFNEKGSYYLWIGGRMDLSGASPGSYFGQFTLEVAYI